MLTLPDIATTCGISLNLKLVSAHGKRGPEYQGPCPRCGGENRFHIWPEQYPGRGGSYWCRQCKSAGDGIDFLIKYAGCSFQDACWMVGKKLDNPKNFTKAYRRPWKATPVMPTPTPAGRSGATMKPRECEEPSVTWRGQAQKYVDEGNLALMSNPAALERLERNRGITKQTVAIFSLGLLLPRPGGRLSCRFSSRKLWGLEPKESAKKPDCLWLPRGLIIPAPIITDQAPGFSRIRIRRPARDIVNGGSKFYIVPGSGMAPLLLLDKQPAVVVVESELDAILIYQEIADLCGVLALGNSSARPDKIAAARLNEIPLVLLAFDNDAAGDEAADRWQQWYGHTVRLKLPERDIKDPGELYQAKGNIREWISAALPSPWR